MLAEKEWQAAAQGKADRSCYCGFTVLNEQAAAALLLAIKNGTPMLERR